MWVQQLQPVVRRQLCRCKYRYEGLHLLQAGLESQALPVVQGATAENAHVDSARNTRVAVAKVCDAHTVAFQETLVALLGSSTLTAGASLVT